MTYVNDISHDYSENCNEKEILMKKDSPADKKVILGIKGFIGMTL
jgi:hypothetical protein